MPIHERGMKPVHGLKGDGPDGADGAVFMIWRRVLACFSDMDAVHIDCVYGSTQVNWLIRHRITALPSSYTWTMAAKAHSLGMMVYLKTYSVPCTNINDIAQYALDCNFLRLLVFICDFDIKVAAGAAGPVGERSSRRSSSPSTSTELVCPRIDSAVRHGYADCVKFIMYKFANVEIRRPEFVIQHLAEHNSVDMLKLIVPRYRLVPSYTCLLGATRKGSFASLKHCLSNMDSTCCDISVVPPDLLVVAAEHGRINELVLLADRQKQYVPDEVYHRAFQAGQVEVCTFLKTLNPRLKPSLDDIEVVCTKGFEHMIKSLEFNVSVHGKLIVKAIRSKNSSLVRTLVQKMPHLQFKSSKQNLLLTAANTGDSDMLLTVFDVGKYSTVPSAVINSCIEHSMHRALRVFRKLDLFTYTEPMIIEACRMCDDVMLSLILKSKDLARDLVTDESPLFQRCQSYIVVSAAPPTKKHVCHLVIKGAVAGPDGDGPEGLDQESAMIDQARALKRPKHIH